MSENESEQPKIDYKKIARTAILNYEALGGRDPTEPRSVLRRAVMIAVPEKTIHWEYTPWDKVHEAVNEAGYEKIEPHVESLVAAFAEESGKKIDPLEIQKIKDEFMDAYSRDYNM